MHSCCPRAPALPIRRLTCAFPLIFPHMTFVFADLTSAIHNMPSSYRYANPWMFTDVIYGWDSRNAGSDPSAFACTVGWGQLATLLLQLLNYWRLIPPTFFWPFFGLFWLLCVSCFDSLFVVLLAYWLLVAGGMAMHCLIRFYDSYTLFVLQCQPKPCCDFCFFLFSGSIMNSCNYRSCDWTRHASVPANAQKCFERQQQRWSAEPLAIYSSNIFFFQVKSLIN